VHHREELRIEITQTVTATVLGNPDLTVPCQIADFSTSGIGIVVGQEIPEGSAVKVDWGEHFLVGRVVREASEGAGYRVGLELLYCSQWSGLPETAAAR